MTNGTVQLERIGELIEKFIVSYGKARIAFYIFPALENYYDFTKYMRALTAALRRANCVPAYSWTYDAFRGCYNMILIVQGYFRNDMNDVTDAAQRIWKLYSPFPVQFIAEMPVTDASIAQDKMRLWEIMNGMQFTSSGPQRLLPPHQRAFACSKLY